MFGPSSNLALSALRPVSREQVERVRGEPDCTGAVHWLPVVEDVKGFRTKEYELKKKLMAGRGIHVVEV